MSRLLRPAALATTFGLLSTAAPAFADNPIVQHVFTADPAPMVHGDSVYLYSSHDEDVTLDNFFTMNDWRVFSSKDMVNWTDHGSPLSYQSFSWATGKAWAPQCVERNGQFYFYVPVSNSIGVAVSDSPTGPFTDPLGKPLLSNYQYIDPTVFIDEDGQAYLYFGNPKLWYVKLNEDMISYSGQVQQIPNTTASFGTRNGDADRPTKYEEGPWFYRRSDLYYMVFASGPLPETISYSTSPGPIGPWTYKSTVMDSASGHAFTNHAGTVDFKGHSYLFYHTQELPGGSGYKRSVALEEFQYGTDGSIPKVVKTKDGPAAVGNLNPYERVEGETIAWTGGVEIEDSSGGGRDVGSIENNDYIKVKSVNFRTGAVSFEATVASAGAGGDIELHLDSQTGSLLGTCSVQPTGGWQTWTTVGCDVATIADVHDLFLVFKGGGGSLFNLDWWQFTPKDPLPGGSGGSSAVGGSAATGGATAGVGGQAANSGGQPALGSGGLGEGGDATSADSGGGGAQGCACKTGPSRPSTSCSWLALGAAAWAARSKGRRTRRQFKAGA